MTWRLRAQLKTGRCIVSFLKRPGLVKQLFVLVVFWTVIFNVIQFTGLNYVNFLACS